MISIWNFLKGKKTYFIAFCMLVTGLYLNDNSLVLESLAIAGLRNGMDG